MPEADTMQTVHSILHGGDKPLPMQREDFACATSLLKTHTGIMLGNHKADMAARILGMQARAHGCTSISAYLDFLRRTSPFASSASTEQPPQWQAFINAFTVNHTAFFRERHHFDILADFVRQRARPVRIWCSASSSGEEPYSIAMTLMENGHTAQAGSSALVLATDIDSQAIAQAQRGVYTEERVKGVDPSLLKKYFQHGIQGNQGKVRVKPALQACVHFQTLNLLQSPWGIEHQAQKFDAIFCRNTMIYFEQATQIRLLERFAPLLKKDGLLFVGHSENFAGLTRSFALQGQTVYRVVA